MSGTLGELRDDLDIHVVLDGCTDGYQVGIERVVCRDLDLFDLGSHRGCRLLGHLGNLAGPGAGRPSSGGRLASADTVRRGKAKGHCRLPRGA